MHTKSALSSNYDTFICSFCNTQTDSKTCSYIYLKTWNLFKKIFKKTIEKMDKRMKEDIIYGNSLLHWKNFSPFYKKQEQLHNRIFCLNVFKSYCNLCWTPYYCLAPSVFLSSLSLCVTTRQNTTLFSHSIQSVNRLSI